MEVAVNKLRVVKNNLKNFGFRYAIFTPPYLFFKTLYDMLDGKTKGKKRDIIIKEVNDYLMALDKNAEGIHQDLIVNQTREIASTKIMGGWLKGGDVVLDLGANIGYYAILESKRVGKNGLIYAVEPAKENYHFLKQNINLNKLKNVQTYNLAFGDKKGVLKLYINEAGNLNTAIKKKNFLRIEEVPCATIDGFLEKKKRKPTVLRMDVEGFEYEIIKGGRKSLEFIEKIFMEIHFSLMEKQKTISLLKTLKGGGFEIYKILIECETSFDNGRFIGKTANYFHKHRFRPKILNNLTINKILNSPEILKSLDTYKVFFEKKK